MKHASPVIRGLLGAGLLLIVSAVLAWLTPDYISHDMSRRVMGVLFGAMFVAYANDIPKAVAARTRCAPAIAQRVRRFIGWALVLGGLGDIAAWLLAPIEMSNMIGGLSLGTAFTVAALRLRWLAHHRIGG